MSPHVGKCKLGQLDTHTARWPRRCEMTIRRCSRHLTCFMRRPKFASWDCYIHSCPLWQQIYAEDKVRPGGWLDESITCLQIRERSLDSCRCYFPTRPTMTRMYQHHLGLCLRPRGFRRPPGEHGRIPGAAWMTQGSIKPWLYAVTIFWCKLRFQLAGV